MRVNVTTAGAGRRLARHPRLRALAALAGVALVVAACAASSEQVLSTVGNSVGTDTTSAGRGALPAGAPEIGAYPGTVPAGGSGPQLAPDASAAPAAADGAASAAFKDDAKVVKTGSLTLEVKTLDDALATARTAIVGLGGYVSGSDESNDGDRTRATIVYRIPAARWDDALAALRHLATKVVGERTNAVEVTSQVIDLDARVRNLRATESALQAIMAKATKISDILEVQQQLTEVRGQIEQLSTEQAHLVDQAALGTLAVEFSVPVAAVTTTREGWDPGAEVDRAVASLVGLGQGIASFGIWLAIVVLPVLVLLAILGGLAWVVARRIGLGRGGPGYLPPAAPNGPTLEAPAAPEA